MNSGTSLRRRQVRQAVHLARFTAAVREGLNLRTLAARFDLSFRQAMRLRRAVLHEATGDKA